MRQLRNLSNHDLWRSWTQAIDEWVVEPRNRSLKAKVDRLEDEIMRRMREAYEQGRREAQQVLASVAI
ncbi:MAG: hypothetical protein M1423_00705 [Acidobacteria bacterium]|nr:hypothetical protein [Acidobacteriota bacterium]